MPDLIEQEPIYDISDLLTFIKKHKNFEELLYGIQVIRSRPYSRISAITNCEDVDTVDSLLHGKLIIADVSVMNYVKKFPLHNGKIRIYRGGSEIRPGDWVALEYNYAKGHGTPVYTFLTSPRNVVWATTYEKEFYFIPEYLQKKYTLEQLWNEANKDSFYFYNLLPVIGALLLFSPIITFTFFLLSAERINK